MARGSVQEANLGTTQGNLGMKGQPSDHSTGGCTVIALLVVSAFLVDLASSFNLDFIIDVICQKPLKRIRDTKYPGKGFVHVSADDAVEQLSRIGLFASPYVSTLLFIIFLMTILSVCPSFQVDGGSGLSCDRFAGDIFENGDILQMFVTKIMNTEHERMAASFYFRDHRFAVSRVLAPTF